jgi:glycosyltransferase involved in cell wall biosynthesis
MAMGGAENLAVNIANGMAAAGHESHLIVTSGPGVLSERIAPDVRAHYLGFQRSSVRNPLAFLLSLRRGYRLLSSLVAEHRIEVLQTHLPGSNFWGLMLAWADRCAVLATVHNNQEFHYGDTDNALRAGLRRRAYQQILRRCRGVIAVSEEVRASLARDLGANEAEAARMAVVTNAVAVPGVLSPERRAEIRRRHGISPDAVFILAAGRLCAQKNFGDLLDAAAHMVRAGTDFRLVVAGEGEDRETLERRLGDLGLGEVVSLPGNLTDLDEVMGAADMFVMTSLWEGLPLVLLEAMAAGLPVVAYGIPGIAEVVRPGITGLVAPTGIVAEFGDAVASLVADPERRASLGRAGRAEIEARYDFRARLNDLEQLYAQAARD